MEHYCNDSYDAKAVFLQEKMAKNLILSLLVDEIKTERLVELLPCPLDWSMIAHEVSYQLVRWQTASSVPLPSNINS